MSCCKSKEKPKQAVVVVEDETKQRNAAAATAASAAAAEQLRLQEEAKRKAALEKQRLAEEQAKKEENERARIAAIGTFESSEKSVRREVELEWQTGRDSAVSQLQDNLEALERAKRDADAAALQSARNAQLLLQNHAQQEESKRNDIDAFETQTRIELEDYIREELTVQELREKHAKEKAAKEARRRAQAMNLNRLLAPLQGHCMPRQDVPEAVERMRRMPVRERVLEEIRHAHASFRLVRGTTAFLNHADPHNEASHGDGEDSDVHQPPRRSTSVASRQSLSSEAYLRSCSVNSAWARDNTDRWNPVDFNMAGVPRYSPRRIKPRVPHHPESVQRGRSASLGHRSASCGIDYEREATPGPGSHTLPLTWRTNSA